MGLFRNKLEPKEIGKIRRAACENFDSEFSRFTEEISEIPGRRDIPGKAGRPQKNL